MLTGVIKPRRAGQADQQRQLDTEPELLNSRAAKH